jgi:hypothetical protein
MNVFIADTTTESDDPDDELQPLVRDGFVNRPMSQDEAGDVCHEWLMLSINTVAKVPGLLPMEGCWWSCLPISVRRSIPFQLKDATLRHRWARFYDEMFDEDIIQQALPPVSPWVKKQYSTFK